MACILLRACPSQMQRHTQATWPGFINLTGSGSRYKLPFPYVCDEAMGGKVTFSPDVEQRQDVEAQPMPLKQEQLLLGVAALPEGVLGSKDPRRILLRVCPQIPNS